MTTTSLKTTSSSLGSYLKNKQTTQSSHTSFQCSENSFLAKVIGTQLEEMAFHTLQDYDASIINFIGWPYRSDVSSEKFEGT